jgi:hypothetical protein
MILRRDSFGAWWQAAIVMSLQLVGSAATAVSLLVLMAQMLLNYGSTANVSAAYTALFVFITFSIFISGLSDTQRITEFENERVAGTLALEFMAWRTFIVTIAFPFLALAYAVYANVSPAPPNPPSPPDPPSPACAHAVLRLRDRSAARGLWSGRGSAHARLPYLNTVCCDSRPCHARG